VVINKIKNNCEMRNKIEFKGEKFGYGYVQICSVLENRVSSSFRQNNVEF